MLIPSSVVANFALDLEFEFVPGHPELFTT